jgi:hypothetical protein
MALQRDIRLAVKFIHAEELDQQPLQIEAQSKAAAIADVDFKLLQSAETLKGKTFEARLTSATKLQQTDRAPGESDESTISAARINSDLQAQSARRRATR